MAVVMEPFDRRVLDGAVPLAGRCLPANTEKHPSELAATQENSPPDCFLIFAALWVVGLGQAVLDPVGFSNHVETHWPKIYGVAVPRLLGELDSIVLENGVDLIGHSLEHVLKELPGRLSVSRCNELSDGELGGSVNPHKEIELSFSRLHLGNVPSRACKHALPGSGCGRTLSDSA